jgi:hypothetical protein
LYSPTPTTAEAKVNIALDFTASFLLRINHHSAISTSQMFEANSRQFGEGDGNTDATQNERMQQLSQIQHWGKNCPYSQSNQAPFNHQVVHFEHLMTEALKKSHEEIDTYPSFRYFRARIGA